MKIRFHGRRAKAAQVRALASGPTSSNPDRELVLHRGDIQGPVTHFVMRKVCVVLQRRPCQRGCCAPCWIPQPWRRPGIEPLRHQQTGARLICAQGKPPSSPKNPMAIASPIDPASEAENDLSPPTPPHVRTYSRSITDQVSLQAPPIPPWPCHGDAVCGRLSGTPSVGRFHQIVKCCSTKPRCSPSVIRHSYGRVSYSACFPLTSLPRLTLFVDPLRRTAARF